MPDLMYVIPREESDLQEYIDNDTPEGRYLEFKSGRLLGDKDKDRIRRDLSKDICGLANAGGGVIVIGIREEGKEPSYAGRFEFPDVKKSAEWLEKVLVGCAQPSIVGLEIFDKSVGEGNCIIIHVPYSFSAPHQAIDKVYYARRNFQNEAMPHYEIEDVRSRKDRSAIDVKFDLEIRSGVLCDLLIENSGGSEVFDVSISMPTIPKDYIRSARIFSDGMKVLRPRQKIRISAFEYRKLKEEENFTHIFTMAFLDKFGEQHELPLYFNPTDYHGVAIYPEGVEGVREELNRGLDKIAKALSR